MSVFGNTALQHANSSIVFVFAQSLYHDDLTFDQATLLMQLLVCRQMNKPNSKNYHTEI